MTSKADLTDLPAAERVGRRWRGLVVTLCAPALILAGCGSEDTGSPPPATAGSVTAEPAADSTAAPPPLVLATTTIWADVTRNVACEGLAEVDALMPPGADPHQYEPSFADRARLDAADLIVTNGLDLEGALEDTLTSVEADGTPVFVAGDHITTLAFDAEMFGGHRDEDHEDHDEDHDGDDDHDEDHDGDDDHDEDHDGDDDHDEDHDGDDDHDEDHDEDHDGEDEHGGDEDHTEDEHTEDDHDEDDHDEDEHTEDDHDEDEHDHGDVDPHVWLDPVRVAQAVSHLAEALVDHAGLDTGRVAACADAYLAQLAELHDVITGTLAPIPAARRKLVTNHDSLGYFADRYDFEVIGSVIPATTTLGEASPASLEELAGLIEATGVPAIFAEELGHSTGEAAALANRLDGVTVESLYTGALGAEGSGAESYLAMMRHNATVIAGALGGS